MQAAIDRIEFAPPPTRGLLRALGLAILAHAFLLAALTWGVHWKRETATVAVEAELWSAQPQQAAPPPLEPPPEPVAQKAPEPPPAPALDLQKEADIVLARERQLKLEREKQRLAELEKKRLLEKERLREKLEQKKKAAEEKRKVEQLAQQKEALRAKQEKLESEARIKANLERMMKGLPGAAGASDAKGNAQQSSGPSANYAGRVAARIKPNLVFTEDIAGNPLADVEVRAAPNGTILSRKLVKSSGLKSWDDAVLKAIDKTEKLPPDTDGRVPASLIIGFRPKD